MARRPPAWILADCQGRVSCYRRVALLKGSAQREMSVKQYNGISRRNFLAGSLAGLTWTALGPSQAQSLWQPFEIPATEKGLVNNPRLVTLKGKVTLFWAGTNSSARNPEVMFCNAGDDDTGWGKTRAPFFGSDLGRVRRLAVATARDSMALVFQRETTQGNGAVEVLLTLSGDSGYSFAAPFVMDSYVLGQEGGSYVSVAARQGKQRPEFAALWVAEGGVVRASNIDPRSGFRPRAVVVGELESIRTKAEVVGAGGDGFHCVWPEGGGLKTTSIKPLTGSIDTASKLTSGDIQRNFSVASYYRGPGFIAAATEGGDFKIFQTKDGKLAQYAASKFPLAGRKLDSRCALEGEQHLHMAIVEAGAQPKIHYTTNRGGSWSPPETVQALQPDVPVTGFDITVSDSYVWIIVGQEQLVNVWRRKIG